MQLTKNITARSLSSDEIVEYHENGFVIVKNLFDEQEIEPIRRACKEDPSVSNAQTKFADADGNINTITHWVELGNSLLGVIPRMSRLVDAVETLLGGEECYHWHSNLVKKAPHSKGKFGWHQFYGGVYEEGCLFPDFVICFIAVDKTTRENGCLQVVKKSNLLHRIDHRFVGDAMLCDPERMEKVLERLEVVYCEMEAGDVMFMGPNTIHASDGNSTDKARTNLVLRYNAKSNEPYSMEGIKDRPYIPIEKLPDSYIMDEKYDGVFETHKFVETAKAYQTMIRKNK